MIDAMPDACHNTIEQGKTKFAISFFFQAPYHSMNFIFIERLDQIVVIDVVSLRKKHFSTDNVLLLAVSNIVQITWYFSADRTTKGFVIA